MRDQIIKSIFEMEWELFSNVNASGEAASCQQDFKTFSIMRHSQAETWSDSLLQSYQHDLINAKNEGRNLMTEKYAMMMKYSHPEEFSKIKDRFPEIKPDIDAKIEEIIKIYLEWDREISEKYPKVRARSRRTYSHEDTPESTSFETYFRGELQTYSEKTIDIYEKYAQKMKKIGVNLGEMQLLNTAKSYGYKSLEELNERLSNN